jgi:AraC-like DNA-binding protein
MGPLLFFYIKSLGSIKFKLKPVLFLHFSPAVLCFIILLTTIHVHSIEVKREVFVQKNSLNYFIYMGLEFCFFIHIMGYLVAIMKIVRQYFNKNDNFCCENKSIKLNWLKIILEGFFLMWLVDLIASILFLMVPMLNIRPLHVLSISINFFSIILLLLQSLKHSKILLKIEGIPTSLKYKKSSLDSKLKKLYLKKLLNHLENDEPYLNSSISLTEIARNLHISSNYLSQVINELMNTNYYQLINRYRIKYAIKLMSKNTTKVSILEIVYMVGFNSRSTFYSAFKQETGMTPNQYQKKIITANYDSALSYQMKKNLKNCSTLFTRTISK